MGAWIEIIFPTACWRLGKVAPFVGAWIEIVVSVSSVPSGFVAPFVGAWIEISGITGFLIQGCVAPFVGTWIEICLQVPSNTEKFVAPFVGAWIEIFSISFNLFVFLSLPSWERGLKLLFPVLPESDPESLPSWERGLKSDICNSTRDLFPVAPFVGAWIEIGNTMCRASMP